MPRRKQSETDAEIDPYEEQLRIFGRIVQLMHKRYCLDPEHPTREEEGKILEALRKMKAEQDFWASVA